MFKCIGILVWNCSLFITFKQIKFFKRYPQTIYHKNLSPLDLMSITVFLPECQHVLDVCCCWSFGKLRYLLLMSIILVEKMLISLLYKRIKNYIISFKYVLENDLPSLIRWFKLIDKDFYKFNSQIVR